MLAPPRSSSGQACRRRHHSRRRRRCCCLLQAFYKASRLEFVPMGVVGAIVPWNWPFHNVINPISAAVFAGNAIVIKVMTLQRARARQRLRQRPFPPPSLGG